eukprot:scaffold1669_cov108-Isochrysis_galbana.AAC.8
MMCVLCLFLSTSREPESGAGSLPPGAADTVRMAAASAGSASFPVLGRRMLPIGLLLLCFAYLPATLHPSLSGSTHESAPASSGAVTLQLIDLVRSRAAAFGKSIEARGASLQSAERGLGRAGQLPPPQQVQPAAGKATAAVPASTAAIGGPSGAVPSIKACPGGCAAGTCNQDLGRCDCEPFYTGSDCADPLFPACVEQHGLRPHVAACGIHAQPAFPTTCECMLQCFEQGLDARQECLVEPRPGEAMAEAEARFKKEMSFMPMVADPAALQMTRRHAKETMAGGNCSGNGILSIQLPYVFYPKKEDCVPTDRRWQAA